MKVDIGVGIKNKFTFMVDDIITGEHKEFEGHNIVLNAMWSRLVNFQTFFVNIHFGTGTGLFDDPTRTGLYTYLNTKPATTEFQTRLLPTSTWRKKIVLNPEEFVGAIITEVGVAYGTLAANLVTHAAPKDSEGNPISIGPKTDTQIITIYADMYFVLQEVMYGGKIKWVTPLANNELLSYLMGGTYPTQWFKVGNARSFGDGVVSANLGQSSNILISNWIKDAVNKKVTTPVTRLGTAVGNGDVFEIGIGSSDTGGTFKGIMPITSVYSDYAITSDVIGTGNDLQTSFDLSKNFINQTSVTVKKDGILQAELTDYTKDEFLSRVGYKLSNPSVLPTGEGRGVDFSSDGSYMAITHVGTPFISIYKINDGVFVKLANPDILPTGNARIPVFSNDGIYLAVTHENTPFITIYKRDGDTFTKLANPDILPTGNGFGVSFSPDGQYLSVGCSSTPFIAIYKRNADTFTKLANPDVLPPELIYSSSFSPDGTLLAIGHYGSPWIAIYKRNADTFTKLANPDVLPPDRAWGVSFSPDGQYLSVAHWTTPFLIVYKVSGETFTKINNPSVLPTGNGLTCSFYSNYLAISHNASPYLTLYEIKNDILTKITSSSVLPTSVGNGVKFSPDGNMIGMAIFGAPYVFMYDTKPNKTQAIFTTPPPIGAAITADYTVDYIPKDTNHVLDLQAAIQYGEVT